MGLFNNYVMSREGRVKGCVTVFIRNNFKKRYRGFYIDKNLYVIVEQLPCPKCSVIKKVQLFLVIDHSDITLYYHCCFFLSEDIIHIV